MSIIFFKEPGGEWKGPYNETQVQQKYRKDLFTTQFEFMFTDKDQKPSRDAKGTTLGDLITHNGPFCAFQPIEMKLDKKTTMELQLSDIEKKLETLKAKCNDIRSLQDTIGELEKRLEKMTTVGEIAAPEEKKQTDKAPEKNDNMFDNYAELVIEVLNAMELNKFGGIAELGAQFAPAEKEIKTEKQKKEFLRVLMAQLKEREYTVCWRCNMLMQHPKHAILHLVDPNRPLAHAQDRGLNAFCDVIQRILLETVRGWMMTDMSTVHQQRQRFSNISPRDPKCVPSLPILRELLKKHTDRVFAGYPEDNPLDFMRYVYPLMATIAPEFLNDFNTLMGDKPTRCVGCTHVTGDLESYCKHVTMYSHISLSEGVSYQEPTTFFINYLRRNEE